MVFSSAIFIFGFLPLLLICYFLTPKNKRNYTLLIFSLIFYGFGEPVFLFVMIAIVMIDYVAGILIEKYEKQKKAILILSLILNLGLLFYYKYTMFFLDTINIVFNLKLPIPEIVLPIGISFFTFQALSYVIDVYKKEVKVQKNPLYILLYVSMFPQLIAGPIVRYQTVENEITKREYSWDSIAYGIERFVIGFAKKLIVSNHMGRLADIIFQGTSLTTDVAWIGAVSFTLQIYFDFSGYSDMAIGLGRILGFHFNENFNYPYISKSITEFWRRWHISLSTWFRDYVYIPLGGNRKGALRHIFNMFVVWFLTGFWHGASFNFILWGLYYFIFLLLEKYVFKKVFKSVPNFLKHIYSLIVIVFGWVLFNCTNLEQCFYYIKTMVVPNITKQSLELANIYIDEYGIYFILGILFSTPIYKIIRKKIFNIAKDKVFVEGLFYASILALFYVSIAFLTQATYNPFIYFRF